tara:strand:+ start:6702 stop:7136 length:435 start_codon:yes stop_codon:yes gene_type:complete
MTEVDEIEPVLTEEQETEKETIMTNVISIVKDKLSNIGLKLSTLSKLIQFTMEAIEDTPVKGQEQKVFALKVMKGLIEELPEDNPEKILLLESLKSGSVDGMIELVVAASKNELTINHVVTVSKVCLPNLFKYINTKCASRSKK